MRPVLALICCLLLLGCGIDGAPVPPEDEGGTTGVAISGEARIGVVGGV